LAVLSRHPQNLDTVWVKEGRNLQIWHEDKMQKGLKEDIRNILEKTYCKPDSKFC
jgi:hypothetical protein